MYAQTTIFKTYKNVYGVFGLGLSPRFSISSCSSLSHIRAFSSFDDIKTRFKRVKDDVGDVCSDYYSDKTPFFPHDLANRKTVVKDNTEMLHNYSLENVESAVMQFVPDYILSYHRENDNFDEFLTPGQAFFAENKGKLLKIIRENYHEKKGSLGLGEGYTEELLPSILNNDLYEEAFGSYNSDDTVRLPKGYLWDYHTTNIHKPRKTIELRKGAMPSIQQIIDILEQERLTNIISVDLNKCGRRDQGLYAIVATGSTRSHCRRVGRMLYRIIVDLEVPFVSKISYCCNSRDDDWIITHLGPLCVHLMIEEDRNKYSLEEIWSRVEENIKETKNFVIP